MRAHMGRHSLSGSLTSLQTLCHWLRVGASQVASERCRHGQSIQASQIPAWPPMSQTPIHNWWEVPPCCCKDWSSRRHGVWMSCKGAYRPPMRMASQAPTGKGVSWKLTPFSPNIGGADSDGYSTVSEAPSGRHHRRRRKNEKCLSPAHLDMLIFKSTDPNVDVMYILWRFDMQGWLDQYHKESMMPHIIASLQGYPGRWVHSLGNGRNITIPKLLACMDHAFSDVHDYDTMIRSLYEIRQKES